jgi:hypothetical protein
MRLGNPILAQETAQGWSTPLVFLGPHNSGVGAVEFVHGGAEGAVGVAEFGPHGVGVVACAPRPRVLAVSLYFRLSDLLRWAR